MIKAFVTTLWAICTALGLLALGALVIWLIIVIIVMFLGGDL